MSSENNSDFPKEYLDIHKDFPYSQIISQNDDKMRVVLDLIEERLRDIEKITVNKKSKKLFVPNRPQKFLMLLHLGMLKPLVENGQLTLDQKARLLSVLLDEDYDNLHGNLSTFEHISSTLNIEGNYKFLVGLFKYYQINDLAQQMEEKLNSIISAKNARLKNKK